MARICKLCDSFAWSPSTDCDDVAVGASCISVFGADEISTDPKDLVCLHATAMLLSGLRVKMFAHTGKLARTFFCIFV
jgi:hypothetical protein